VILFGWIAEILTIDFLIFDLIHHLRKAHH
jgi:hypothetical protein